MAEAHGDDDEIFVYMGGNQQVPRHIRRARIHKSVKIVRARAFICRYELISVEFHDGVEIIEEDAFGDCWLLKSPIKLLGVKIIKARAFWGCRSMAGVEFGDKLQTIEHQSFSYCATLKKIRIPSVRFIREYAFSHCEELSDVECSEALEIIQRYVFQCCAKLERIALPLKGWMIFVHAFHCCPKLETVDLVGGIHQTVASLHLVSWRSEMTGKINRINQTLPTTDAQIKDKSAEIHFWMRSVISRLDHYKAEHKALLKEATTLLELALWKANLRDNNGREGEREGVRTTRGSRKRARKEVCVTSGADVVIKNVLPFLQLDE